MNAANVTLAMNPVRLRRHRRAAPHAGLVALRRARGVGEYRPKPRPEVIAALTRGGLRDDPLGHLRPTSAGRDFRAQFFLADRHPRDESIFGDDLERLPSFHLQEGFCELGGEGGAGAKRSVIEVSRDEDRRTACDPVLPRAALLDDELASPVAHHLLQGPGEAHDLAREPRSDDCVWLRRQAAEERVVALGPGAGGRDSEPLRQLVQ